jgi:hypothetical protein
VHRLSIYDSMIGIEGSSDNHGGVVVVVVMVEFED